MKYAKLISLALLTLTASGSARELGGALDPGSSGYALNSLGSEVLGCYVDTPAYDPYQPYECAATIAQAGYVVDFKVLNVGGTYSYAWDMTGWLLITPGGGNCSSSSDRCVLSTPRAPYDREKPMSVTVTEIGTGQSIVLTATVILPAVCKEGQQYFFC